MEVRVCVGVSGEGRGDMVHPHHPLALAKIAWAVRRGKGVLEGIRQPPPDIFFSSRILPFFLPACL